jgi:hypothetical protein
VETLSELLFTNCTYRFYSSRQEFCPTDQTSPIHILHKVGISQVMLIHENRSLQMTHHCWKYLIDLFLAILVMQCKGSSKLFHLNCTVILVIKGWKYLTKNWEKLWISSWKSATESYFLSICIRIHSRAVSLPVYLYPTTIKASRCNHE